MGNGFDIGVRAFVSIITLINPLCIVPIFLSLTREQTLQQRNTTALRGTCIALCLLFVVCFGGDPLFHSLGISFSSFKIAGGILLFSSGFNMVTAMDSENSGAPSAIRDVSVFPLGIPLIGGPGVMTTGTLFMAEAQGDPLKICAVIIAIFIVFFINWLCMNQAECFVRILGQTGLNISSRVFGIIIVAIATELIVSGIQTTFHLAGA